jgi:glycosyltransferase involved in cell wall biosynthesis
MKDLGLVMPVYNEEECILEVIQSWHRELSRLKIEFIIIVLNDGSTDTTAERLKTLSGFNEILIVNKENSGHGPTILLGYRLAVEKAQWVFQVDSDNEITPDQFEELWAKRENYDGLFGYRQARSQTLTRKIVSVIARNSVKLLFGQGVEDSNVPYRLLRAGILKKIIGKIPPGTFAPNVIISGAFSMHKLRIYNQPVFCFGRKTGKTTLVSWKILWAALPSFLQTIGARYRLKEL